MSERQPVGRRASRSGAALAEVKALLRAVETGDSSAPSRLIELV